MSVSSIVWPDVTVKMSLKSVLAINPHGCSTKLPLYLRGSQASMPEVDVVPRSWSVSTESVYLTRDVAKRKDDRCVTKKHSAGKETAVGIRHRSMTQ